MEEAALPLQRLCAALCGSVFAWMGKGIREAATGPWGAVQTAMGLSWLEGVGPAYARTASRLAHEAMVECAASGAEWAAALAASEGVAAPVVATDAMVGAAADALAAEVSPTIYGLRLRLADGRSVPIRDAYADLLGEAHELVMGGSTEDAAIRRVLDRLLGDGGVYLQRDGRTYDLYGYTRQRVMEAWRAEAQAERDRVGRELHLDGVEVSAHWNCAPDHLPYQGRVYSRVEMAAINATLGRPIGLGVMNCRHILTPCHADSTPSYTREEREAFEEEATREVEVMGHTMTRYEATQWQRAQERRIREAKVMQMASEAAGDEDMVAKWHAIQRRAEFRYREGSRQAGLRTDWRRAAVGRLG